MTIQVPELADGMLNVSETEARLDLAIGLYTGRRISMGKAAKVAGISYSEFLHELGHRGICVNYGVADFAADLETLRLNDEKK